MRVMGSLASASCLEYDTYERRWFGCREGDGSLQMVIEVPNRQGAETIVQALDGYKARLRIGIERTNRRLASFETRYGVDTARFLREMTAEDLTGGDMEYVEWAGEAKLLEGLVGELKALEYAHYQLS